jgi:hypothetical protein
VSGGSVRALVSRPLRVFIVGGVLAVCLMGASPSPAVYADKDILQDACATGAASQSAACKSKTSSAQSPLTGSDGFLMKISRLLAVIAGVVAVIIIAISGFKYMTSGGDAQQASSAKRTLLGAIIGLAVIVLAQAIISFVIRRL